MDWHEIEDDREKYKAYLCSREWSVLKEAVAQRARNKCERCKVFAMDHVHHLTYARKYQERLEDLQACCMKCHAFIHAKSDFDPSDERSLQQYCIRVLFAANGAFDVRFLSPFLMAFEEQAWKTAALLIQSLGIDHLSAEDCGSDLSDS